ncbi:hypothetical protein JK358_01630 [Nocardia sp. 2]|uniref:Secreted protein n=1 Tax=Nocardia acididurans TaxID=2802282 RepID=A0ABS1LXK7_9NOCA|nr:hypothetical protein [Nocardia acididurans]MBL1073087.1 hypothetical protein [Nocardia acididurans]
MIKKILLATVVLGTVLGIVAGPARADTFSSSRSGSCSGTVGSWGYFYAYTYQYAYIAGRTIESESHSFSFSGFLSGAENAELLKGEDRKWIIYRSGDFDIAVPYVSGAGLFVQDNRRVDRDWIKLCSY